jgi:hypothetical protein
MWWAFAIVIWTLLSLVASPLIGGALAGGRTLRVREETLFEAASRPLRQGRRLA